MERVMKDIDQEEQIIEFSNLWHLIYNSNKLNLCTESLEGVSPVEISILRIVEKNPQVILREICQSLNIVNSTLTSAVNRLEKRGFIQRIISNRDRRSFGLKLTDDGKSAIDEHLKGEQQVLSSILNSLDDGERIAFLKMFRKIVDSMV
jgi:DNA-binding MarR family transcriptional regulator